MKKQPTCQLWNFRVGKILLWRIEKAGAGLCKQHMAETGVCDGGAGNRFVIGMGSGKIRALLVGELVRAVLSAG